MESNKIYKSEYQIKLEEIQKLTRVEIDDYDENIITYQISKAELTKWDTNFQEKINRNNNNNTMARVRSKELYTK